MREDEDMTITEFLLARIAEDEAMAANVEVFEFDPVAGVPRNRSLRDRVLAECAAKRSIVEFHESWPVLVETKPEFENVSTLDDMALRMTKQIAWTTEKAYRDQFGTEPPTTPMLAALATVYADHPDYRQEWKP